MRNTIQERTMVAILEALKPIARALLRNGIGFREFVDVAKMAFVDVASRDYGIRGRPTNISRVAVMTGLTRKEVKRLRGVTPDGGSLIIRRSPPADLLHYWHTDPDYLTRNGVPKQLPYEGSAASFVSLVKRCAGDVPPGAMRTELKRIGAIVERENGELEAVKRHFIPSDDDDRLELGLNLGLQPLASTIAFNCDSNRQGPARFQRISYSAWIDRDDLLAVQDSLSKKLGRFLVEIDHELAAAEGDQESVEQSNLSRVGVGVFFFAGDD